MSAKHRPSDAPSQGLADAAARIEAEVREFERLTQVATRVELDSHKGLDAAAEAVNAAAASHARFGEALRALIEAVTVARDRQAASAEALNARSEAVATRRARFEVLRERFGALGATAREINELMQRAHDGKRAGGEQPELLAQVASASARMTDAIEQARALAADAGADGLIDLERQADALRQQISSARNRLEQLAEKLRG